MYILFLLGLCLATPQLLAESLRYHNHLIPITECDLSIVSGPRDYWTLLTFTSTDPKHECTVCEDLPGVIGTVAQSWWAQYINTAHHVHFLEVDIVDRTNIPLFDRLQFDTIPHIWLFPPNMEIEAGDESDAILGDPHFVFAVPMASVAEQTAEFARFLAETMQKPITVNSEDPTAKFVKTFVGTFLVIVLLKKKGPSFLTRTHRRQYAAFFFIGLILVCLGGYGFTSGNGVPFLARNDKGGLIYISGGTTYQFGIEIPLIMAVYSLLAAALVGLVYVGGYEVGEGKRIDSEVKKLSLVVANSFAVFLLYSVLTSMVMRKDHGYAYGFWKLF